MTSGDSRPVALVTGATRGIGAAVAAELGRTHRVLVGGRSTATVADAVRAFPDAAPFVADLSNDEATAAAAAGVGRLDVLVHCAGITAPIAPLAETSRAEWARVLEVNVVAVAELTRLLLPRLRASHGTLVLLNSVAGLTAEPGAAPYSASKHALRALADALRREEVGRIRVVSLYPGAVDTDMQRDVHRELGLAYNPEAQLTPNSIAEVIRTVVELPGSAVVESLTITPQDRSS